MSEDQPFLRRWSQRKRAAADGRAIEPEQTPPPENAAPDGAQTMPASVDQVAVGLNQLPAVDVAALPPLESITAETDIRGFLAPGIPAELRHAALRRAWAADASIRDFIGLTENDWDVLAPAAAAGVEPATMTDAMRRFVDTLFSRGEAPDSDSVSAKTDQSLPHTVESDGTVPPAAAENGRDAALDRPDLPQFDLAPVASTPHDATQQADDATRDRRDDSSPNEAARPLRHGGALPQ